MTQTYLKNVTFTKLAAMFLKF